MYPSEYDAFGPWIYEITEAHHLPALFEPHVPSGETPLMLFKIPRDIERRRATPDMDLYDYVVGAYEERLLILKRVEHTVETITVSYAEIEGLRLFRHFLRGDLTLYLRSGEVLLPFNAVSMDIVTRFAVLIRGRYQTGEAPALPELRPWEQAPADLDVLFVNLLRELRQTEPEARVYACQSMTSLEAKSGSFLRSLARRPRPQTLPATLHLLNRKELIVIQREVPEKKAQENEYSYHFTYLPRSGIRKVRLEESAQDRGILDCTVELAHHVSPLRFRRENREAVAFYQRLSDAARWASVGSRM